MNQDDLIYDLIFSEKTNYRIDISDYVSDIYKHDDFVDHIKHVLKRAKVKVVKSFVVLDSKTVMWDLKVKK